MKNWTFITNHGLVLLYIFKNPKCTMRDMASAINITERTVHRTLLDLEKEGYITRQRTGRGNMYEINHTQELRHELMSDSVVGDLLDMLNPKRKRKQRSS
jgi:DNA-binding MarR family transcriptional regulator